MRFVIALLIASTAANAEPYSVFSGAGGHTCQTLLKNSSNSTVRTEFGQWIAGYITGRAAEKLDAGGQPLNLRAGGFEADEYYSELVRRCRLSDSDTPIAIVAIEVFRDVLTRNQVD